MPTPVPTTYGDVTGVEHDGVHTFRGIPYAAAPVGELRFAAPAPHPGWQGARPALTDGPTPSLGPVGDTYSIPEHAVDGDERLNLNVFSPSLDPQAKLPVYVWIHGGSYVGGAAGSPWADGTPFARRGIVTVAISYRLGVEGFAAIPGAPENRGLLDQIAALRWVANNITAFGGDPDRVTVGGQSAGAGSVLALLGSKETVGLFHQAISHSAPLPDISASAATAISASLAASLGVANSPAGWDTVSRPDTAAAERSLDPGSLLAGIRDLNSVLSERGSVTRFGPVLGADPVPADVVTAIASGPGANRPLMMGATSHEFNHLSRLLPPLGPSVARRILVRLGVPAVRARAYPAAFPWLGGAELIGQAVTDRVFRHPVARIAGARSGSSAGTWAWDFRWCSPVSGRALHCADLPFAWDALGAERVPRLLGDDPPQRLAHQMHEAICAFITAGDPGWPQYTSNAPIARVFDEESWTGADPYRFERIAVQIPPSGR